MNFRILNLNEALKLFESLPSELQIPSLNPKFVKCDSLRSNAKPIFWSACDKKNIYLHSFLVYYTKEFDIFDIESPYGYGGPICNTSDKSFLNIVNNDFETWCINNNIVAEFLRFHPLIKNYNYYFSNVIFNRNTVSINLDLDLFSQYKQRQRSYIRNCIRKEYSSHIVSNKFMESIFPKLYHENMKNIGAKEYYFFNKSYISNLINSEYTDNWIVRINDNVAAGAIVLKNINSKIVEYHLGARNDNSNRAMMFILHSISEYYKQKRYKTFFLGGGRSSQENDTLLSFKKGFSKNLLDFKIGYKIFNEKKYKELLKKFDNTNTDKILFYR